MSRFPSSWIGWPEASSLRVAARQTGPGPFHLDQGQEGVILALGWPGQWQAQFSQEKDG